MWHRCRHAADGCGEFGEDGSHATAVGEGGEGQSAGDGGGDELEGGVEQAEPEAREDESAGGQADLAFHAPCGARALLGAVEVMARGGPGAGAPGEGGGVDAVLRERLACAVGAGSGGADHQDVAAVGGVVDGGEGT